MTISPLRLDRFVVESLDVRTLVQAPKNAVASAEPVVRVDVQIMQDGDEPQYLLPLTVRLNSEEPEYARQGLSANLKLLGFFSLAPETDVHEGHHLIALNAPSILYGVARGIIAQATALTASGPVVLPAYNFVEHMRQAADKQMNTSDAPARPRPAARRQSTAMPAHAQE